MNRRFDQEKIMKTGIGVWVLVGAMVGTASGQACPTMINVTCCITETPMWCCVLAVQEPAAAKAPDTQSKEPVSVLAAPIPDAQPLVQGQGAIQPNVVAGSTPSGQLGNPMPRRRLGVFGRFFGRFR
jgi:hypothetical protein